LQIDFHALHEGAREGAQIADLRRIFARQDEPELVPVLLATLGKSPRIGLADLGAISLAALTFAT
jgi:hypothetical protein